MADTFVDVDGSKIRYRSMGRRGTPIVFLHGNGLTLEYWDGVMETMNGRRRVSLDLIGHGRSDRPQVDYDRVTHHRYLMGLMDVLDIEQAILVGHRWAA